MTLKIAVVGGGIVGCLSAIKLQESGFDVTLVDKSNIGQESSWAGAGILFPLMPWEYDSRIFELCKSASRFYREFSKKLWETTKIDPEYIESGLICIPPFDKNKMLDWSQQNNFDVNDFIFKDSHSYLFSSIAQIRPPRLMRAIKIFMKSIGIRVIENTNLIKLKRGENNIKKWPATNGNSISADIFVLTSGAWSAEIKENYRDIIYPVRGQIIQYKPCELKINHILYSDDFYVLQRKDGVIIAGSTLEHVGFKKDIQPNAIKGLMEKTAKLIPELSGVKPEKHWAGLRPGSKGNIPFIEKDEYYDNIFINSGHYRYGVTMAPKSSEEICNLIMTSV